MSDKLKRHNYRHMETLKDIQKKTQGIVAAVYMVSDFIDGKDPIKIEIRLSSVGLIKDVLSLQMSDRGEYYKNIISVRYKISEIQTLISLAENLCMVSLMNAKIINEELVKLSNSLENIFPEENIKSKSFIIPESIFKEEFVKETVLTDQSSLGRDNTSNLIKSHINLSSSHVRNYSYNKNIDNKKQDSTSYNNDNFENNKKTESLQLAKVDIKDSRKKDISDLIKTQGHLSGVSIKDISKIFTNISEKTIQREITEMLLKGQIKKTGEKRWSRYYPI